jgi:hypothetical protein
LRRIEARGLFLTPLDRRRQFVYPPLRRGIRDSPLLKVGASALLERPGSVSHQ